MQLGTFRAGRGQEGEEERASEPESFEGMLESLLIAPVEVQEVGTMNIVPSPSVVVPTRLCSTE